VEGEEEVGKGEGEGEGEVVGESMHEFEIFTSMYNLS